MRVLAWEREQWLTASNMDGHGKISKVVNLGRSLRVGTKDENPFGIYGFQPASPPGIRNSTGLSL